VKPLPFFWGEPIILVNDLQLNLRTLWKVHRVLHHDSSPLDVTVQ
jgi:hypothetical protein